MPKGFGYGGESANQEKSNLLKDNPIARTAAGDRPWITKHYSSTMGSPVKMDHVGDSPAEKALSEKQKAAFSGGKNPGLEAAIEAAPEMNYDSAVAKKKCHHNR